MTPVPEARHKARRALLAIGFGHALEWYDWGIYAIFVPFFAGQFFDPGDGASAVLSSLAVFAVGFVARPVGGLVVGRLADRIGRRPMMVLTVGAMAAASLLIGISPTYATIGVGASAVLVLARVIQGLATGGELPSAQTYLAEAAPPERRGLWSSVIYIASVGGNMIGVLLGLVLSSTLTPAQMTDFGWRIPFLVGGALGLVALWIRRSLEESEAFTREAAGAAERPRIWPEIVRHRREAAQVVGLSVGFTVVYYSWVIAAPAYAINELGIDAGGALLAGVLASLVLISVQPAWGALSDRIGRRPVLLISCVGTAVLLFPLQAMVHDAVRLGVAMAIAMVFIGAGIAILPAAYAEMFPTRIRAVGLAVPYSVAVAAFGGTAPYLQTWVGTTLGRPVFTAYVVVLLLVTAGTVLTLREGRATDLAGPRPAGSAPGREGEGVNPLDLLHDDLEVIDLAQPLEVGMPTSPTHPAFEFALRQRHGDVLRDDGMTGSHEVMVLGGHVGTHMDALSHVAVDGLLHGGVPAADAVVAGRYRAHGIDRVPPLFRRGVLVDVPRSRGVARLPPGEAVRAEDLLAAPEPRPGDVVLVRTGWAQLWADPPAYLGGTDGVPGVDPGAARWLAERGVAAVGADTVALEHIPAGGGLASLPVHRILLAEAGINLIEVMALEALSESLAARGTGEFLFVGAPLNVRGATGAPIRPLAVTGS